MSSINGGVAVVTGGGSGIGRTTALEFTDRGADVVVVADVGVDGGEGTVDRIEDSSGAISRITGGGSTTTAAVSLDLQRTTLAPEESTTGTVTVENISEVDLTDVQVSVTAENNRIQITPPSETSFDSLAPGESRTLEYDIAVAAEASEGSYGVAAEATFAQEGEETTVTASSAITVPLQEITAPFGYDAGGTETDGTITINGLPSRLSRRSSTSPATASRRSPRPTRSRGPTPTCCTRVHSRAETSRTTSASRTGRTTSPSTSRRSTTAATTTAAARGRACST